MFFERLRRASTVRRPEPAEPASPTSASSAGDWLRRLRPARTPAPDGIRRATSERTRARPARHSTASAPPAPAAAAAAAASVSSGEAGPSVAAESSALAGSTRRPVFRRASASMPTLVGASELSLRAMAPAPGPLAAFLAAGLDAASLRTGPAVGALTLVHPPACFAECAVAVEEWPGLPPTAEESDAELETVVDAGDAAPPARVPSLPRSTASRIGRSRKRAHAGAALRPLSVESVRRRASKRRRSRHRAAAAAPRRMPAARVAAVQRLRARRGRRPRFATRAEA